MLPMSQEQITCKRRSVAEHEKLEPMFGRFGRSPNEYFRAEINIRPSLIFEKHDSYKLFIA